MLRSTCGIGLAATKPSLPLLLTEPAMMPERYCAFVDVAEVAAGVLRMLALGPQAAAMAELDVGNLPAFLQHVRVEVAERRREHEGGAVEVDHALHRFLDGDRLGHLLLFHDLHARHLLQDRSRLGVRLVVAVVVARADIDEADHQRLLRVGRACQSERRVPAAPPSSARRPIVNLWIIALPPPRFFARRWRPKPEFSKRCASDLISDLLEKRGFGCPIVCSFLRLHSF
jgi:hypothetical protein